jgi:hypothetical protein
MVGIAGSCLFGHWFGITLGGTGELFGEQEV